MTFNELNEMITALNRHQSLVVAAKIAGYDRIDLALFSHSIETAIFCRTEEKKDDVSKLVSQYAKPEDVLSFRNLFSGSNLVFTVELRTDIY